MGLGGHFGSLKAPSRESGRPKGRCGDQRGVRKRSGGTNVGAWAGRDHQLEATWSQLEPRLDPT